MDIEKTLATKILKYLDEHPNFYFPFSVMHRVYALEEDDFIKVKPDEWKKISEDHSCQTFQIWENLQNLDEKTLYLILKGFLEVIIRDSLEQKITEYALEYRSVWSIDKCDSEDDLEYGFNEFLGGKAEGFEESRRIIRKYYGVSDKENAWSWPFVDEI